MKKLLLILVCIGFIGIDAIAQKGEIWATYARNEFEISDGKIGKEYESEDYYTFYMFINNNEFIHCTNGITSLYKILSRQEGEDYIDYKVISEVGNQYSFSFYKSNKAVIILNLEKGYGFYNKCYTPYSTTVFDNINR